MADEKKAPHEEIKWWIDGPSLRESKKKTPTYQGVIERWAFELLKDYEQNKALENVVDINKKVFGEFPLSPREWAYISLGIGKYPSNRMAKIRDALTLPHYARALAIDAGYSVRVLISGDPVGERVMDFNFTEDPSLDYWVKDELIEERLFSSVDECLRASRNSLRRYLSQRN